MNWKDIVLTFVTAMFVISLIPQVYTGFKEKKGSINHQTSIPTFLGCFIITGVYISLDLYVSSIFSLLIGLLWMILFIQRIIYRKN